MKINSRVFVSFAMTLQILILLFGIAAVPVAAEEPTPSWPLVLQGTVEVDGEPAPENTVITAKVNGDVVGTTEVDQEGVYGSQPETKLYITCERGDYENIKFYVNGVESSLISVDAINNANPGDDLYSVNMVATSPVGDSTNDGSSGSSGGGSYSGTATTSDSSTNDESSSESTASASTTSLKSVATAQSTDDSAEEVPASETGSSMMAIMIGVIVLLGIIATVGYKLKEN